MLLEHLKSKANTAECEEVNVLGWLVHMLHITAKDVGKNNFLRLDQTLYAILGLVATARPLFDIVEQALHLL
ncbi:hypothetical protein HAX54_035891 [Datura stramonium]|uniref:Uncharacterized protein n=1 Tax=Datura stramonium TaxID=4076 RepID=A0ABS8VH78_DATST|nr:hypothetical protein [Datura stramonium]